MLPVICYLIFSAWTLPQVFHAVEHVSHGFLVRSGALHLLIDSCIRKAVQCSRHACVFLPPTVRLS
jgi:hypothetical protein